MTANGLPHHMTQAECDRLKRLRDVHTIETCAELMGRSSEATRRCIARGFTAYVSRARRARPSDFGLLAHAMTQQQLARHYRTGQETVRRWGKEIGRKDKSRGGPKLKRCPPDFRETYERLGNDRHAAGQHYGVCEQIIQRWREESGLPVKLKRKTLTRRASTFGWVDKIAAAPRGQSRSHDGGLHV